jgi:hypothetical protein
MWFAKMIEADGRFAFNSSDNGGIEITDDEHGALMAGQVEGKRIVADEHGRPILTDPQPPSSAELASAARAKRDRLLSESDWIVTRSIETGDAVPPEWMAYRQALRDVPEQSGFPQTIGWPVAPQSGQP